MPGGSRGMRGYMPIREYVCDTCHASKEVFFHTTEQQPDEYDCDHCSGIMKRAVSLSSFSLKGGGWGSTCYSKVEPSEGK
jgi:putative FmdB family regulatory protein